MAHAADITRSRIFEGLTDADRGAWLDASSLRLLKRRQTLARQGEPAHSFYLVENGLLKLVQITVDGHELIVRFVGPGEPFGGVVALDGATYPAAAAARGVPAVARGIRRGP
jgi:CRP/FNR family transcriptional regulator, nitrogen oxide reductase regulator